MSTEPKGGLPAVLFMAGILIVVAGFISGGPDVVGGIVFGALSIAAGGAILYGRRHQG